MTRCIACGAEGVEQVADLGPQPISSRFLVTADADEVSYPMLLGRCPECALIQLVDPVSAAELAPPYDWITYNEPEAHLDELAERIRGLPGVAPASVVAGVSAKDDSTLERLARLGVVWSERAGAPADVVVARHVLEHAHDVAGFIAALARLVKPDGYAVVEIPGCTRALETLDYCTLWEEHIAYFTAQSFATSLEAGGLAVQRVDTYPYPFEDSLVAICRPAQPRRPAPTPATLEGERARLRRFVDALPARRAAVRRRLESVAAGGGTIAFFGAGHLTCTFIMLMGIADLVAFVIDDNPKKKGLFMPGSRLAIVGSGALGAGDVSLCLMAMSPASEEKVIAANQGFVAGGGTFASVIPSSERALEVLAAAEVG